MHWRLVKHCYSRDRIYQTKYYVTILFVQAKDFRKLIIAGGGLEKSIFCLIFLLKVVLFPSIVMKETTNVLRKSLLIFYETVKNWFMLSVRISRGKFGEHERSVRVARGDSREQL